jgi:hypothetical protein
MARTQDEEGGDGLQIWRVVANILKKETWKSTRGGPTALKLGVGLTVPHRKKRTFVTKCYAEP